MRRARSHVILTVLTLSILPLSRAAASNDRVGTSVFPFLKIGVGARPMGMAGAFTAIGDDPHAIYWNPAGLGLTRHGEASATYVSYFSGVDAGTLVYARPVRKMAGFGASVNFLRVGGIQETTNDNRTGTGLSEFSSKDLAFSAAWGSRVFGRLYAGASASYLYEGISAGDGYSTTGSAFNLGLLYNGPIEGVTAGIAVRNWGYQLALYDETPEELPLTIAGGIAIRPLARRLLIAVDAEKPRDNDLGVNVGAEFQVVRDFFARAGYRSIDRRVQEDSSSGDLAGLTFGLGIVGTRRYHVDYAYASFADLGDVHRITLSLDFR